jgi:hypothetical protein
MNSSGPLKRLQQLTRRVRKPLFLAGLLAAVVGAQAQTAVTDISYGAAVNGGNTSQGGISYDNRYRPVNTVTTGLGAYRFDGPLATDVYARRNTNSSNSGAHNQGNDNPNNTTIIYQYDGGRDLGTYEPSLEDVFLSGNLYTGIRNPFANGTASEQNSNIERLDFFFAGGYTVQANDALVFFDVENLGNFGDGFRIAAYTAVDGSNTPTTYANTGLLVPSDSFGGPIDNPMGDTSGDYRRSTFTNGDSLAGTASDTASAGELQLVGILIRFADLGIAAGTTIYGYSLMAGDVTPATAANLVNWNNAAYYPTNTDPGGYGNMDFMGFGAQISRPVPEPSTYGAMLLGAAVVFFGWRRWRQAATARAA